MSARDLLNSVHSSESLVKWIWSGLARGGSPFPASVSIKLHLSSKHLKPGDAQWVTLFSANLECGHTVLSGEGKLNVPSAVHTDGWARMLLHAVNKEEEVYLKNTLDHLNSMIQLKVLGIIILFLFQMVQSIYIYVMVTRALRWTLFQLVIFFAQQRKLYSTLLFNLRAS